VVSGNQENLVGYFLPGVVKSFDFRLAFWLAKQNVTPDFITAKLKGLKDYIGFSQGAILTNTQNKNVIQF
jgi:hypothetical protein